MKQAGHKKKKTEDLTSTWNLKNETNYLKAENQMVVAMSKRRESGDAGPRIQSSGQEG